jgi:hypothetical protein
VLSELVRKLLEERAGMRIRYSRDCDILSAKIFSECRCSISGSTLRRLLGFTKGTKEPRLYTLDVLANYLGFSTWDDMLIELTNGEKPEKKTLTELKTGALKPGERFRYTYKPSAVVEIEYIGKSKFKVLNAENSKLVVGDIFKAKIVSLHHPLIVLEVERDGEPVGRIIEARISGITSIEKM